MSYKDPAIGMIETLSIAKGMVACDTMAKKAPVSVLQAHSICPGKFLIIINGEVSEVEESMMVGENSADHYLVDKLFLPHVDPQVGPAITRTNHIETIKSVGIIETFTAASIIYAADAAAKCTSIKLIDIRIANGLGGKSYLTLTGELYEVEATIKAGVEKIDTGLLVQTEIIPAPHPDFVAHLF